MSRVIVIAVFAVVALSCRKDDSDVVLTLPAETQAGANTFGFRLDGVVWTNFGQVCQPNGGTCRDNLVGTYFPGDGGIAIEADQVIYKDGVAQTQHFQLDLSTGFGGEKTYKTTDGDYITVILLPVNDPVGYATADMAPDFTVTITRLDVNAGIISGTFSGKLFRVTSAGTSTTDFVAVTEGRFDLKL